MAKNDTKKKPRTRHITLDFGKPTKVDAFSYDPISGQARFFSDGVQLIPEQAFVEQSYERKKGPKVLLRSNLPLDNTHANPNMALEQYSEIYAVDTNTKLIADELVSVCGVVGGIIIPIPEHTAIRYKPIHCMEYRGLEAHPEKVAWVETIEAILRSPSFSKSKKYAVIVDAYLGELAAFNSRSEPLIDGFHLPPEFTLAYASADAQNEGLANQMLSMADKIASTILKSLENSPTDYPLELVIGKPYKSRRLWKPKG